MHVMRRGAGHIGGLIVGVCSLAVAAFADGHSEIHKWKDPRTTPPLTTELELNVPSPNNQDVYWMQEHSTRLP